MNPIACYAKHVFRLKFGLPLQLLNRAIETNENECMETLSKEVKNILRPSDLTYIEELTKLSGNTTEEPQNNKESPDNKKMLFSYLHNYLGCYLPPYQECNIEYLLSCLTGKKKLLREKEVLKCSPPCSTKITMKIGWEKWGVRPEISQYLPGSPHYPNRNFFFNIVNTLTNGEISNLIKEKCGPPNSNTELQEEICGKKRKEPEPLQCSQIEENKDSALKLKTVKKDFPPFQTDRQNRKRISGRNHNVGSNSSSEIISRKKGKHPATKYGLRK